MEPIIWNKYIPVGIGKIDHYNEFSKMVGIAFSTVKCHKKIGYIAVGAGLVPILYFCDAFRKDCIPTRGSYFIGKLDYYPVLVTNTLGQDEFRLCTGDTEILEKLIKVFDTNLKVDRALSDTDISFELKESVIATNHLQEQKVLDCIKAIIDADTVKDGIIVCYDPSAVCEVEV